MRETPAVSGSPRSRDEGASGVEYGLFIAVITLVIAGALLMLSGSIKTRANDTVDCFENVDTCDQSAAEH